MSKLSPNQGDHCVIARVNTFVVLLWYYYNIIDVNLKN